MATASETAKQNLQPGEIGRATGAEFRLSFVVKNADPKTHTITAIAMISKTSDGKLVVDLQDDFILPEDLEKAAHDFAANSIMAGGVDHDMTGPKFQIVESFVFTVEKMAAMGIPAGTLPVAWYVTARVDDEAIWKRIESGELKDMSILGHAIRVDVPESEFEASANA